MASEEPCDVPLDEEPLSREELAQLYVEEAAELPGGPSLDEQPAVHALSEPQVQEIVAILKAGRRLPPYLFPHIFEAPKESELTYLGKMRKVDVLAETMAVPLQAVKMFGAETEASNMLIFGDNIQVLQHLLDLKTEGRLRNPDGTDGIRLCYIDPPFGTGKEFAGSDQDKRAYDDRVADSQFIEFLRRRLIVIRELLADDGSVFVHLDARKGHYIKLVLDEVFGPTHFLNEIIWSYRRWPSRAQSFQKMHETIFWYRKGSRWPWHQSYEAASESYMKRFGGKTQVLDAETGTRKITSEEDTKGMPMRDVWEISIVAANTPERRAARKHPTQKPRALVQRIIEAASLPGDWVLDAFAGSGTTAVAAELAAGGARKWVAIDSGKLAIYTMQQRLLRIANEVPNAKSVAFTLYNAGLYDYAALRALAWGAYRRFALRLFQCRDEAHDIAGIRFDGWLQSDPVLVFDFRRYKDATIGEEFIGDIARLCGGGLGRRCFLIAPAMAVEPYEDYIDVGDTRFFFLRIPYSIIADLHKTAFSELRQPTSSRAANATIDSVGFDFIQPPRVEAKYWCDDSHCHVQIEEFESHAYAAMPSEMNIADLAMVMVDYDYDGQVFGVDAVHYADEVAKTGWTVAIPRSALGEQLMLVYLDVFGNEHRALKTRTDFGIDDRGPHGTVARAASKAPRDRSRGSTGSRRSNKSARKKRGRGATS